MKMIRHLFVILCLLGISETLLAQKTDANVFGDVKSEQSGEHIPFVSIYLEGTTLGITTDHTGHYLLVNLPAGEHTLVAKSMGYEMAKQKIKVESGKTIEVNFVLKELVMSLDDVVVTGTKTFKRKTESPVIVNVLESKALDQVQACNISEGLRFQPGLRVETDCQTCNYTQLRMNGLGGGYSQILINGRPIFSPLTGLYGMEQIPANMVERIEVVRGGGSALYGSSAIGGTVNVITKIPSQPSYDFGVTTQFIDGKESDVIMNGNISMLNQKRNAGASIYVNRRTRNAYDANGDNYSELPELKNNSFGANLFYKPSENQKLELSFTSLHEYRYGGEIVDRAAHLAKQSEERTHDVLMAGLDYQINFNEDNSSFIAYAAGQYTERDHYTGIYPDDQEEIDLHLSNPPYGDTENTTLQFGTQINHRLNDFLGGKNVLTVGTEYVYDDVLDSIPRYSYGTDQTTKNFGGFFQSDWEVRKNLNFLAGLRVDKHNLVDNAILSPRLSLLYKYKTNTQLRLTWGTGFRAPQAFDSDMHIAFAGGGISRIVLANDLKEERSNSLSGSINYDKATEKWIAGFTLEGFYTKLDDAFYLEPLAADEFGERFEKRNGSGAKVQGATLELRANYNRVAQFEAGFTLQSSKFDEAVENIEGLEAKREFLRTPEKYGYASLSFTPSSKFNATISSVYTGPMLLAHFGGAPEQSIDEYKKSDSFTELNLKLSYAFKLKQVDSGLELFGGIKNITNAYQDDFDSGKNRDSNYVYGPGSPRTFYIGVRLKSW
ncbi:TonB-dependent receptor [Marinifilum sp. D714]|uniref:TonB-dependent receptor n=1 Tax=Marinifilum sp. D714 TaxID=2937523 RepID=UPI0027D0DA60|nr:TonB-dependent receptor [Marinifilum sp. D714]MDQ2180462.1 TonB-dependent receptor [Marinifilum sp. D714]